MTKRTLKRFLASPWVLRVASAFAGNTLLVLGYHRIARRGRRTDLADSLFGPDELEFEQQVARLARDTQPMSETMVLECISSGSPFPPKATLVTFDDGYRDNFTIAAPILKRFGVPAIFFIPTASISERRVGWWDEIAWTIKETNVRTARIAGEHYDLSGPNKAAAIESLIARLKAAGKAQRELWLADLRHECRTHGVPRELADSALMTWEQVHALQEFVVSVGGHTVTHCMLSELDEEAQARELSDSKAELELRTGRPVLSVAYPFGGADHFNAATKAAARRIGFRLGFSLVRGINRADRLDPLAIHRIMPPADINSFALRVNLPGLMLNGWRFWNGRGAECALADDTSGGERRGRRS